MDLIYNTTGSVNGFDDAGHFLRTALIATNCVDYSVGWASGCDARFEGAAGKGPPITRFPLITEEGARPRDATAAADRQARRATHDQSAEAAAADPAGIELGPPRPDSDRRPGVTATPGAATAPSRERPGPTRRRRPSRSRRRPQRPQPAGDQRPARPPGGPMRRAAACSRSARAR